ncbi:MAG: hypothetical protein ACE364_10660 [Chlorobiota bacterium]
MKNSKLKIVILICILFIYSSINSNQDSSAIIDYNSDILLYDSIVYRFNRVDSAVKYKSYLDQCKELKIEPIMNTSKKVFIRMSLGHYIVSIWKDNNMKLHGNKIHWVTEIDCESGERIRDYSISYDLDNKSIDKIYNYILDTKVLNIPDQSKIFSWIQGDDGVTYTIESKIDSNYKFQSYWSPSAQKNVRAAYEIEKFIDKIKELSDYSDSQRTFSKICHSNVIVTE